MLRSTMRLVLVLLLVLPVALLLGCPARIDGSSAAAVKISLEEIKRDLSSEDRARFERALIVIVASELGGALSGGYGQTSTAQVDHKVAEVVGGKTVDQVIAHADALRAERNSGSSVLSR